MKKIVFSASVGIGGKNNREDIKTLQGALNTLRSSLDFGPALAVDGSLGKSPESSKTVAALKIFQKKMAGFTNPDGLLNPEGRTHNALNKKLLESRVKVTSTVTGGVITDLRVKLEKLEGRIDHIYLDTKGFVTVGVGHLISNAEAAKKLPFVRKDTGAKATAVEIEAEYNKVKGLPFGKRFDANSFRRHTELILPADAIDALTDSHIRTFTSELRRLYGAAAFDNFPVPVKVALYDMIFNLGMTRLKDIFPKLNRHIKNGDWAAAAEESKRTDVSLERNEYVKNLFLEAERLSKIKAN